MTLAFIFSSQNNFRWKYLEVFYFAVSLSIYIWVFELKKSSAAAEVAKESVTFQTGFGKDVHKIERTSWTFPLKTESWVRSGLENVKWHLQPWPLVDINDYDL